MPRKNAAQRRKEEAEERKEARREFVERLEGLSMTEALIVAESAPASGWLENFSSNLAYFINTGCSAAPGGSGRWERGLYKLLVTRWVGTGELPPETLQKLETDVASNQALLP